MLGFMQEVGPCMAVPVSKESITTVPREWSWDGASNMLFIDQVCFCPCQEMTKLN